MSNNKKGYEAARRNDGKKHKIGLLTCRRIARMLALKLGLRRTDAERLATASTSNMITLSAVAQQVCLPLPRVYLNYVKAIPQATAHNIDLLDLILSVSCALFVNVLSGI